MRQPHPLLIAFLSLFTNQKKRRKKRIRRELIATLMKKPPIRDEAGSEVVCLFGYFFPTSRAEPERAIHRASEGDMKRF